eukprot:m.308957 g.308957  ORF g.308957 m.308957 type:complete len:257 (+) comp45156_c0_seq1:21-791(+)
MSGALIIVELVLLVAALLGSCVHMVATWVTKGQAFGGRCFLYMEWSQNPQNPDQVIYQTTAASACNAIIFSAFGTIALSVLIGVTDVITLQRMRKNSRNFSERSMWRLMTKIAVVTTCVLFYLGIGVVGSVGFQTFCNNLKGAGKAIKSPYDSCKELFQTLVNVDDKNKRAFPSQTWLQMHLVQYSLWFTCLVWVIILLLAIVDFCQERRRRKYAQLNDQSLRDPTSADASTSPLVPSGGKASTSKSKSIQNEGNV